VSSLNDRRDFDDLRHAMKVLGFEAHEQETLWKLVAVVLHLVSNCNIVELFNSVLCIIINTLPWSRVCCQVGP